MDIRNFFSPKPSSKSAKTSDQDKKKKTKKIIISDSESDDDSPKITTKHIKKSSTGVNEEKKQSGEVEKSKYFKSLKPVKPSDVFGSAPIKQTPLSKPFKKRSKPDLDDDEFDELFLQLSDDGLNGEILNASRSLSHEDNVPNGEIKKKRIESYSESDEQYKHRGKQVEISPQKNIRHKIRKYSSVEKPTSPSKKNHEGSLLVLNGSAKELSKKVSPNVNETNSCIDLCDNDSDDHFKNEKSKYCIEEEEEEDDSMFSSAQTSSSQLKTSRSEKMSNLTPKKDKKNSPEKKNRESPASKNVEKVKNSCIDMSDSGSSDSEKIESPQKRKAVPDIMSSPKRRKVDKVIETGLGRKSKVESPQTSKKIEHENVLTRPASKDSVKTTLSTERQDFNRPPTQKSELWVDKYRPASLKQLIGQQGDKSIAKKLSNWLLKWNSNHCGSKKLQRPSPWAKDDDGGYFKAALLSGPPGIGKTTTAHLVCKELGYDVVEFNASDTRSKKLLHQEVSELLSSKSLAPFFTGSKVEMTRNHVLVMDEVDGMAGNEDRGGIQELIQLVKSSHVPIICMCNDRNHQKMRSLVNYCFDLRFSRPRVEQIKGAMMSICFKEGLKIAPDKLSEIIKSTDQDIRLILNHLSVLAAQKDSQLPNSEKFVKLGPWDVLRKVFSEEELKKMSFNDKSDLFFHDYSIAPLFVQENYLNVVPHAKLNKKEKMAVFAKAAESICNGDLVDRAIRSRNAWSLLPVQAVFSSVVPGDVLKGHMGGQINFPAWLGKNSSRNKMDRLLQELLVHTRLRVSASKEAINLDYSNHLRDLIVRPLLEHGSEGVNQSMEALKNYDLLKEDLESLSELCRWPNSKDPMSKVESKVKAAFTRAYNKSSAPPPYAVASVVKKGRAAAAPIDEEVLDGEERDFAEDEEEDDKDSIEVDAMILVKKKSSKSQEKTEPSTSKGKASGSKRGKGRGK